MLQLDMHDKLILFGYFIAAIVIVAAISQMMKVAILATENNNLSEPEEVFVLENYKYGNCQIDSDCAPAGCSLEVCSSDVELVTTCEVKQDFPDKDKFYCGCLQNNCVWRTN